MPWNTPWMVDDDCYHDLLKTGPFVCHVWLPKCTGPAILTQGGKSRYILIRFDDMASRRKVDKRMDSHKTPRNLCNDIMPHNVHKKSTQERTAALTYLHQTQCTAGKCKHILSISCESRKCTRQICKFPFALVCAIDDAARVTHVTCPWYHLWIHLVPRLCLCRKRQLPSSAIVREGLPVGTTSLEGWDLSG